MTDPRFKPPGTPPFGPRNPPGQPNAPYTQPNAPYTHPQGQGQQQLQGQWQGPPQAGGPPVYGVPRFQGGPPPAPAFRRLAFFNEEEGVGARWWQQQIAAAPDSVTRRSALSKFALVAGGVSLAALGVAGGCGAILASSSSGTSETDLEIQRDAIELQQKEGWDVGRIGDSVTLPTTDTSDSAGRTDWATTLSSLVNDLEPAQAALKPHYVSTLFQVLTMSSGESLRDKAKPMLTVAMDEAYARGLGLATLFADVGGDTALIVDLPGPESVAFAAGLAGAFDPVFVFDNWPHPAGVVPSHQTLAAAIYFRPAFAAAKKAGAAKAPMFVLDGKRLTAYTDESSQFDNRYVAKLPTAAQLTSLGVKHVLYVTPDAAVTEEQDDINDDLVAYQKESLDVKAMAATDISAAADAAGKASARDAGLIDGGAQAFAGGADGTAMDGGARAFASSRYHNHPYYYGGSPGTHYYFWRSYGWHSPPMMYRSSPPPMRTSPLASYRPAPRTTLFSSRTVGGSSGIGKVKPSGFGRVSVTQSHAGVVTGTRFGGGGSAYPSGRSGSWGRSGTSSGTS